MQFGSVRALIEVSFHVRSSELFSMHQAERCAGKTLMLNCVSGRYTPTEGRILLEGKNVIFISLNNRAALGIGQTFQNIALFGHMSVLDNIMVGRHHLKNNVFTGWFYWLGGARREVLEHCCAVEDIVDFLESAHVCRATVGPLS